MFWAFNLKSKLSITSWIFVLRKLLFFVLMGLLFSCGMDKVPDNLLAGDINKELFTILDSSVTNITFENQLKESLHMNGLFYEYFYNGGGVAVGDLNGDGLPDIYFSSNLKSNKIYLNEGNLTFRDVTDISGLKGNYGFFTGVTMVDLNGDGRLDIYACKSGLFNDPNKRRNELYINKGNNSQGVPIFEERAKEYGLDLPHYSTQASFFDYDKDGDLDMFLINHGIELYPDVVIGEYLNVESDYRGERLFRNDKGTFGDVTKQSGIKNNMIGFGLGLAIGDLNNDGWPDILVGNDYSEKDHMYLNQKDGTFLEVINESTGHISNFSMGNDISDFNNDGWLDFVSLDMMSESNYDIKTSMSGMNPDRFYEHVSLGLHHQYMYNTLQLNNGNSSQIGLPLFSDIAQLSGVSSTDWSWTPLLFDMDNDGFKDLFVSNGIKRDFRNNDFLTYRKEQQEKIIQLKKEGKKFDQKAYVEDIMDHMPKRERTNYFYKNNGDLTFSNKSLEWVENYATNSNGAAYADFDNDGDMDIVVNNVDSRSFIYRNNTSELGLGNYLKVKLSGPEQNKIGIGTRLIVEQGDEKQILEQYLTRGFQSSVSEVLHFGLGQHKTVKLLTVLWPDGKIQLLQNINVNQTININYSDAKIEKFQNDEHQKLFRDITESSNISYHHKENEFNDFKYESLLPHKMSNFGPALAIGDVDGDGLDDFYVGGAKGYPGALFIQKSNATFFESKNNVWNQDKNSEDIGAIFFDANTDGYLDLYVVSGGSKFEVTQVELQDRLYLNDGKGHFFKTVNSLPQMASSGSVVRPYDFDSDGDLDLFVAGRLDPGKYPFPATSTLLRNDSSKDKVLFTDVTNKLAPEFNKLGLITDAVWTDVTGDNLKDLVIVGEWTPVMIFKNNKNSFTNITSTSLLSENTGWWYSITSADMDNDGDMDLIAGNLGLNYKYKATQENPFEIFVKDFDKNKTLDIVLSYSDKGNKYPLRGRECSSNQMPFIKEKFPSYSDFGSATLSDVFLKEDLETALHYKASNFASSYIENLGDGTFKVKSLPNYAQFSSVNRTLIDDYNGDGIKDIVIMGNMYGSEIETPRNDASLGMLLLGNGQGDFEPVPSYESGIYIKGDSKDAHFIYVGEERKKAIIVVKNNDKIQIITIEDDKS